MAISKEERDVLVKITGTFENSGDPYQGVSGDFDGQGISCGVLQWNIGQNSLQPLVKAVGQQVVLSTMPMFGQEMWAACNAPLSRGLEIVRSWQSGASLKAPPKAELKKLMGSPQMRQQQESVIDKVAVRAEALADTWASDRGASRRTIQELVWFFDIITQNGSMKGLTFGNVSDFKAAAGPGKADDLVCDWLAGTTSKYAGMKDCHENARLWRNAVNDVGLDLLVLSYLRAQLSNLRWRGDVLNRKGALAVKVGYVHGTKFDFSSLI